MTLRLKETCWGRNSPVWNSGARSDLIAADFQGHHY
jgi:hypothetical protein